MNFSQLRIMALFTCLIMLLPACGPRDTRSFPHMSRVKAISQEQKKLEVVVKYLSSQECSNYFGVNVLGEGYCPLQICIVNNGPTTYTFRPSYLNLERASGTGVAKLMHYDTYQRVMLLSLPALFFWWPAIPLLVVPYGIACSHYNEKKTYDVHSKALGRDEVITIAPYEQIQKFIFVPDHALKRMFDMSFFNEDSKELETFTIDLIDTVQ